MTERTDCRMVMVPRELLEELISAARSVNRSSAHLVKSAVDDDACYWQRKEWIDWLVSLGEQAAAVALPADPPGAIKMPPRKPVSRPLSSGTLIRDNTAAEWNAALDAVEALNK